MPYHSPMTMELAPTIWATLGLGFVLGIKHATEADHVVAVSAIVTEHRNALRCILVGAIWGIGHTAALLAAGLAIVALRTRLPDGISLWLETAVAAMIVALGVGVLLRLRRGVVVHVHAHEHDGRSHVHAHSHGAGREHVHAHHGITAWGGRALAVGVIHGLAGGGALAILVMQKQSGIMGGLAFIAVFGLGTVAGMMLMSGAISVPLVLTADRYQRVHKSLCGAAGLLSIAFGVYYGCARWL